MPKEVAVNCYNQLSDGGRQLASWDKVEGGHSIAHPGKPVARAVPLAKPEAKPPVTFLRALAEKRGLKVE